MKTSKNVMQSFGCVLFVLMSCSVNQPSDTSDVVTDAIKESGPVCDIDGTVYKTVQIGDQIWIVENLNVCRFKNGDPIPEAKTKGEWLQAGAERKPVWCYYENNLENGKKFGKLYNWYAANDPRGLAPEGWTVPNNGEWARLISNLGGSDQAGSKMKSTTGWVSNGSGDNYSRFTALPGGGRTFDGDFTNIGDAAIWWSSLEQSAISAWGYNLNSPNASVLQGSFNKTTGLSVRCLKRSSASDDSTSVQTLDQKLQNILDVSLASSKGKGISAAVIMPDGQMWVGASGISHGTTKVTPAMRFSAGSIEKMFAAATIMQLAQEGRLTVKDSLYQWLPTYPYVDSTITIQQLLNHTGGLYNFVDNRDFWDAWFREPTRFWTLEELILTFNRAPVLPKGTGWHYSSTGYNLLRMIIKKATGSEIAEVNRERLFIPLGLTNTFTSMGESLPQNIVHGWYDTDKDLEYEDFFSTQRTPFASGIGGEVWSTPADLAKWAKALFHDKNVVTQASLNQMLAFHSPCTGEESFSAGYGLGVMKINPQLINDVVAYGHGGHGPGYGAACLYLPEYGVSIGIMDNTDGGECIGSSLAGLIRVIVSHAKK